MTFKLQVSKYTLTFHLCPVLKSDLLAQLVRYTLPDQPRGVKGETIRFYSNLIVLLDEHFVVHNAVHKPLVRLLRSCVQAEVDAQGEGSGWQTVDPEYEEDVVDVMCRKLYPTRVATAV